MRCEQLDLIDVLDRYPTSPGWKRTDTSRAAAVAVAPRVPAWRTLVLEQIKLAGQGGLTADEVAARLGASILAIRPRLSELRELGQIEDTGQRRKNASDKSAIVWRVK